MLNNVQAEPGVPSRAPVPFGPRFRFAIRALWAISIITVIIGSLLPDSSPAIVALSATGLSDKFDHFLAYAVLAFLPTLREDRRVIISLAVLACALGILLEFLQPSFGRDYEFADMVADGIGILAGLGLALPLRRRVRRFWPPGPRVS